jgi:hypothetical protein
MMIAVSLHGLMYYLHTVSCTAHSVLQCVYNGSGDSTRFRVLLHTVSCTAQLILQCVCMMIAVSVHGLMFYLHKVSCTAHLILQCVYVGSGVCTWSHVLVSCTAHLVLQCVYDGSGVFTRSHVLSPYGLVYGSLDTAVCV